MTNARKETCYYCSHFRGGGSDPSWFIHERSESGNSCRALSHSWGHALLSQWRPHCEHFIWSEEPTWAATGNSLFLSLRFLDLTFENPSQLLVHTFSTFSNQIYSYWPLNTNIKLTNIVQKKLIVVANMNDPKLDREWRLMISSCSLTSSRLG